MMRPKLAPAAWHSPQDGDSAKPIGLLLSVPLAGPCAHRHTLDTGTDPMAEAVRKSSRKRGEDSQQPKAETATDEKSNDKGVVDLGILGESVGFLLKRAQMAVFADFIETFTAVDLRPAQFSVLVIIGRNPGLKQSQVSAALNIKRTNFVPLLDSLEERGLVARKLAVGDRRSHALHLTTKGSTLLTELHRLWADHERRICEQIGTEGRDQLLTLLGRMIDAGNATAPPDDADEADAAPAKARSKGQGRRRNG